MNSSPFSHTWESLFDYFNVILKGFGSLGNLLSSPIGDLVRGQGNSWLLNVLSNILDTILIGQFSFIDLMLGLGLPIYCVFALIKFFK